jgi:hypothetical protein
MLALSIAASTRSTRSIEVVAVEARLAVARIQISIVHDAEARFS